MRLVTDLIDLSDLIAWARAQTFPQLELGEYLPAVERETIDYRAVVGERARTQAAGFRSYDAETRIGDTPGIREQRGSLPPLGIKYPLPESENLRLRQLAGMADEAVEAALVSRADQAVRGIRERVELAIGQALSTGVVEIPEAGMAFEIDYGIPSDHKITAGTLWTDGENSDPFDDLTTWLEAYEDNTDGATPAVAITSRRVINAMLRHPKVINMVYGAVGQGTPSQVTMQALEQTLGAHGLPPLRPYNTRVMGPDGQRVRPIPEDRLVWLPDVSAEPLGETTYGVTAEAIELADQGVIDAQESPGIVVTTLKADDPVTVWTKSSAIALPVIANPELILTAKVV